MADVIVTKRCSKCKQIKTVSEFYKNNARKDGRHHYCKICESKRKLTPEYKAYGIKYCHSAKGKIVARHYNQSEKCKQYRKVYYQSKRGKDSHNGNTLLYSKRHPERIKAHCITNHAIRDGKLPPPQIYTCVKCFKVSAQQYHHPNYHKPLFVLPVCKPCHIKIHYH